ncbi:MAG: hypothetical protein K2W96_01805, partial [Gemmataceae bacterium]|nr:hypothetical protein [Gemmataceae bacterium]
MRGWFVRTPVRSDLSLPPSFCSGEEARHFLGRNLPHGDDFTRWAKLTQIDRISWFWAGASTDSGEEGAAPAWDGRPACPGQR